MVLKMSSRACQKEKQMEFKASKDFRNDAEFIKHRDSCIKYICLIRNSNDLIVSKLGALIEEEMNNMFDNVFNHTLSLDREIYRLNKELVFKEVTNDEA